MPDARPLVQEITGFVHRHFLLMLVGAYLLAAVLPQPGLWLQHVQFGRVRWPDGSTVNISLSFLMLSLLLFNAGQGIKAQELAGLWRRPAVIVIAVIANMAVPILLVLGFSGLFQLWHNTDELENLLTGLALIVSMPVAGSSAAWSQNANGNLSLSLGLIFLSTVLSPFTTPLLLNLFGCLTTGEYSEDLHELAAQGTHAFLALGVVLPSVLGMLVYFLRGEEKTAALRPQLRLISFLLLLLLNYANAAASLPQAIANPDLDFLAFVLGTAIFLCLSAFGAGWLIARLLRASRSDQASLMFGLGMNNNGTGLVLAASALSDHPAVLLPVIFYTLVQQVVAATVDWKLFRPNGTLPVAPAPCPDPAPEPVD